MAIIVKLDVLLAARNVKSKELADAIGITEQNLSLIKQGKIKGFRFSTLDALCKYLDCQPGDLFSYIPSKEDE
ncbi:helix-turn-helix domain-containing protein [Klebsiella quasivariicola]|uniref:helix-turn-helix domain-containing protein n=1 Tax=Klebsiella quasivariicola TaxID=2026240 RepID=UPI0038D04661